ncbi:MAG: NAD(P)-binding oxidoreductase [Myxococcota bacterium]
MTSNSKKPQEDKQIQKILVVGATGGTGRATIDQLVAEGHQVTAFSRNADRVAEDSVQVTAFNGDATNPADVDAAVQGHDAVIITLGIAENPFRVRLFGTSGTPIDVRSTGTRNVIAAMRKHGVHRLVVQSSFGVGETRDKLRWIDSMFFSLLLKPQIADTEVQELDVRGSGVAWVLAQPVHLTDEEDDGMPFASAAGEVRDWKISRKEVARFLAHAAQTKEYTGQTVALSGGGAS